MTCASIATSGSSAPHLSRGVKDDFGILADWRFWTATLTPAFCWCGYHSLRSAIIFRVERRGDGQETRKHGLIQSRLLAKASSPACRPVAAAHRDVDASPSFGTRPSGLSFYALRSEAT